MLFGLLVIGLATLPAIILWLLSNAAGSSLGQNASLILAAAGVIYSAAWMGSSFLTAVTKVADAKVLEVKETFREGRTILWRVMGASVISSLVIGVGYLLLVIPGVIFSVWFSFTLYIVVTEGARPLEAIKNSKEMVKGYFWPVAGRLLVFTLLNILIQSALSIKQIETVGGIISFLLTPYFVLLSYLLYLDVKRAKGL